MHNNADKSHRYNDELKADTKNYVVHDIIYMHSKNGKIIYGARSQERGHC